MDLKTIINKLNKVERIVTQQDVHISTLNTEQGELRDEQKKTNNKLSTINVETATIKKDVEWLKKFFFIVVAASVGGLITNVLMLLFK